MDSLFAGRRKGVARWFAWGLILIALPATAQISGSIFTSLDDGGNVNANLYDLKSDVYLNGGPQNEHSSGLPDGEYFYQVTSPNGVLLSSDPADCRLLMVSGEAVMGSINGPGGCAGHANGLLNPSNGSIPTQLIPFDDTPNMGGEYKVWLIPNNHSGCAAAVDSTDPTVLLFDNGCVKTDNFKVRENDSGVGPNGLVSGVKYYDLNLNGIFDNTEDPVEGLRIDLQIIEGEIAVGDPLTSFTDAAGVWGFFLAEGTEYQACEVLPPGDSWVQTGPNLGDSSGAAAASADRCWQGVAGIADSSSLNFGNVCLGSGGGKTLGFWSNKNGRRVFDKIGGLVVVNALNLVDEAGNTADFASHAQFRSWLLSAKAINMSYMLSAQLAAMALNVSANSVDSGSLIFAGAEPAGCSIAGLGGSGFINVGDLIVDADAELGADGLTPSGDPERVCQEFKKNALDDANNNLTFLQPTPCAVVYGP